MAEPTEFLIRQGPVDGTVEFVITFVLPIRDSDAIAKRLMDYGIIWRLQQNEERP